MPDQLQLRGGTTAQHASFTGASKEVTVDTTKKTAVVHDGATAGGNPLLREDGSNSALALGSAGTPSLKFTGDTNTGIYSPGADQVAISTGGSGRLFVDSSGKVGVGISSPGEALDVVGLVRSDTASDSRFLLRVNSVNKGGFQATTDDGVVIYGASTTNPIRFQTSGSERLRITSDGKLGLGTSSPTSNLSFGATDSTISTDSADASDSKSISLAGGGTASTARGGYIQAYGNEYATTGGVVDINSGNVANSYVRIQGRSSTSDLRFWINAAEVGRFDSNGRLGIGTQTPSAPLHVVGTIYGTSNLGIRTSSPQNNIHCNQDDSDASLIQFTNTTTGTTSSDGMVVGIDSSEQGVINVKENKPLIISTNNTAAVYVDTSQRLLVGSSTAFGSGVNQVATTASDAIDIGSFSTTADNGGRLTFYRSKNATAGSATAVADGDSLGRIDFRGYGVSSYSLGARIDAFVDGEPSTSGDTTDMPGRLVFSTTADGSSSPTERMRVSANGLISLGDLAVAGIANRASTCDVFVRTESTTATGSVALESNADSTNTRHHITFSNANGAVGSISTNASATAYNTSSDYRLKENVVPLTGAADRVNQLQVHRFNFIADPDKTVDGFIAHEAQAVVPECVTGTKDEVDDEGNPVYQGIDQSKLVPLLTAALQEALAEIESLKARVTALEP